jgi:lysine 2,3-aminomutase
MRSRTTSSATQAAAPHPDPLPLEGKTRGRGGRERATLTTPAQLADAGLVPAAEAASLAAVAARYAIAVPPTLSALIDPTDPNDAIARQFIPDVRELDIAPEERADPIGDDLHSPLPGLVHRYPDRVLLKLTAVCAVYCRFCFRREMVGPGHGGVLSPEALGAELDYIAERPQIFEVILTGGDPLVLSPRRVAEVTASLAAIPHVQVLRWHTRLPVAAPERITHDLVAALKAPNGKAVYVGVHVNHARELTPDARAALARLADASLDLVSQTVLLRGVNDDADTLEALFRALLAARVKPYYLHHGDLAPGTRHLRTTIAHGQALTAELRRRLTGMALPAYVLDIPGAHGKVPIAAAHIAPAADGEGWDVTDAHGQVHRYRDAV